MKSNKPSSMLGGERPIPWIWSLVTLLLLLGYNYGFNPGSLSVETREGRMYGGFIDILDEAAPVMLLSLGMTVVIATGGIDLSVGAVLAIAGSLAAYLMNEQGSDAYTAILAAVMLCIGLGLWNGILVGFFGVQPIVATLVLMVAGRGIAQLIADGQTIPISNDTFNFLGGGYVLGLPFSVSIVLIMAVFTGTLVRLSAMGLFIEAVGNNELASHYAAVNVRSVKLFVYGFSGFCAGVAGLTEASDIRTADANNAGMYLELDAILATVIGGTSLTGGRFSLVGSLIGAIVIQTLTTTILASNVPVQYTLVIKAVVVLAVCLLQSREFRSMLLGRRASQ